MAKRCRKTYDTSVRSVHPSSKGKGLTEQHHKKACDINNILAKYQKTGLIDHIERREGKWGDVTGQDYKRSMDLIAEAKTAFYELPSTVRDHFDNDPAEYLDLVAQEGGVEELRQILNPKPEKEGQEQPSQVEKTPENGDEQSESAVT